MNEETKEKIKEYLFEKMTGEKRQSDESVRPEDHEENELRSVLWRYWISENLIMLRFIFEAFDKYTPTEDKEKFKFGQRVMALRNNSTVYTKAIYIKKRLDNFNDHIVVYIGDYNTSSAIKCKPFDE